MWMGFNFEIWCTRLLAYWVWENDLSSNNPIIKFTFMFDLHFGQRKKKKAYFTKKKAVYYVFWVKCEKEGLFYQEKSSLLFALGKMGRKRIIIPRI